MKTLLSFLRIVESRARLFPVLLLMAVGGCTTTQFVDSADREVYALLTKMSAGVPGMNPNFTIEEVEISLEGMPTREVATEDERQELEFLGEALEDELGAPVISLEKALEIAVKNGRDYQARKESLYLSALAYSLTRQEYGPIFRGNADGALSVTTKDITKMSAKAQVADAAPGAARQIAALTGTPGELLTAYANLVEAAVDITDANAPHIAIEQERRLSGSTSLGASVLMKGGARIALALTSNFLRYLTGDPRTATSSALSATIQQPLLGAERHAARENLTQAERDLLYSIRDFTRYRKKFSIGIASDYYRVLESRESVRNNWQSYRKFQRELARSRAEVEAGLKTLTELGRTEQEELSSRNAWVTALEAYQDSLDSFKIRLGLPTSTGLVLDANELTRFIEQGLMPAPDFTLEDAIQVARAARLDYYIQRDRLEDAARHLALATDDLKPDIGLTLGASANTTPGENVLDFDFKRYAWSLGATLDPKLNRKRVRNRIRGALIAYAQAQRSFDEYEDNLELALRSSWRALKQAEISYEIQKRAVQVNEERVHELELKREMGTVSTLDVNDAEIARVNARNALSRAAVDHTLAYLQLWLDMGILYIKEDGQWQDVTDEWENLTDVKRS
ncbi:MAG TPA: TolC family protein [Candidatus Hydrogenedentes bacterium]|nr:TolC family protein [Candidatus Hydrogenedentota bacterium]HIJ74007.1 TolC family protein [Candidatus Hydrogenedentota bacterium]